jgi:hypothetical protein
MSSVASQTAECRDKTKWAIRSGTGFQPVSRNPTVKMLVPLRPVSGNPTGKMPVPFHRVPERTTDEMPLPL